MSEVERPEPADVFAAGRLRKAIDRLSGGDLAPITSEETEGVREEERRLLNDVGELSRQLRRIVTGLRRAAVTVESIAADVFRGTRGLSMSVLDEGASVEETSTSIAEINISLRRVEENISALSNLSQATSTSAVQMATSIDQVSRNADALAHYVEETATAIEEMAVSISNVAENTEALASSAAEAADATAAIDDSTHRINSSVKETVDLADDVMQSAQKGSSVVYETASTMQSIKTAIDLANESITALGRRSIHVGEIVDVIDEIAERTNLLALNAAILASQAGQHGRGFRIVADEIKELSERTAASTREIAALIANVLEDVRVATERVAAGDALAETGVEQAYNAAALLDEISNSTVRASDSVRAIALATTVQSAEAARVRDAAALVRERAKQIERATAEQAQTSQHIGERAVHMSELTEQVRRAAEEQAEASKHIANAMEELTGVVESIRGAVGEQSVGTDHVLRAIEVIKEGVSRNQASIASINNAVDALGREAVMLRKEVERFRLPTPRRGGHALIAFRESQLVLDNVRATTVTAMDVLSTVFEGLVKSGTSSDVVPSAAERWEVAPDGRVYTFYLRRGMRFHNGREVVAADVRYSFERMLRNPANAGAWVFAPIEGAEEFQQAEGHESLSGIEVLDRYAIRITLKRPLAFFLATLCLDYAYIVPREEVERQDEPFGDRPVGSGPFRVVSYVAERRLELARFDHYHDPDRPRLDGLTFEFGVSSDEIERRLIGGDITFVKDPPLKMLERVQADPDLKGSVLSAVELSTGGFAFDCAYPPLDRRDVRQAICHAIDKERFVHNVFREFAIPAAGPIPPGLIGHDPDFVGLEYDPDRAKSLLARSGAGRVKTSLWHSQGGIIGDEFERVGADLAEVGIDLEVRHVEPTELIRSRKRGVTPIVWRSWIGDYPDPDNFTYVLFHSSNLGLFTVNYGNTEIDELAEKARSLMDREERDRAYRRLAHLIVEDAPAVFIMHRRNHVIHRPDVEGLQVYLLTPIVRPEEIWFAE
jgi:ABC-type transport system substrate-binding protein/methyl-accepting chemotaxis protein